MFWALMKRIDAIMWGWFFFHYVAFSSACMWWISMTETPSAPQNQFSSRKPILQGSRGASEGQSLEPFTLQISRRLLLSCARWLEGWPRCGEIAGVCKFGPSARALLYMHRQKKSTFRRWADKKKQMHAARVRISTEYWIDESSLSLSLVVCTHTHT